MQRIRGIRGSVEGGIRAYPGGHSVIGAATAVILVIAGLAVAFGFVRVTVLAGAIMVSMPALFSSLTVSEDNGTLSLAPGPVFLFRKSWPLFGIVSVTVLTNPWHYRWGIRRTPRGPLSNSAGPGAAGVMLTSGITCRIGTDEPEVLRRAIEKALYTRGLDHGLGSL